MASAAGATFTVLFSVSVTWTLIGVLGKAAGGKVASGDVIALIAFAALNYLPTIVILTSFISVLMVVTRTYRDSEMVVWFASGLSLTRWIKPVLSFGLPLVLLTAGLSFIATPWAQLKSSEYVDRFEKRGTEWRVAARVVVYDWVQPMGAAPAASEVERFGLRAPIGARKPADPWYTLLAELG